MLHLNYDTPAVTCLAINIKSARFRIPPEHPPLLVNVLYLGNLLVCHKLPQQCQQHILVQLVAENRLEAIITRKVHENRSINADASPEKIHNCHNMII